MEEAVQSNTELVEISIILHRKGTVVVVVHHSDHVPRGTVQCDGNTPDVLLWNAACDGRTDGRQIVDYLERQRNPLHRSTLHAS